MARPSRIYEWKALQVLAALAGLLAAFACGLWLSERERPGSITARVADKLEPAAAPLAKASAPEACVDQAPLRRRIADLERQLRELAFAAVAERVGRHAEGSDRRADLPPPLPFPSDLSPSEVPSAFRQAAADILSKCFPELNVKDAECSEYPCIAWGAYDASRGGHFDVDSCDEWTKQMGPKTVVFGRESEDGAVGYLGILSIPEREAESVVVRRRLEHRMRAMAEAYGIRSP